jgi:translation initiation factor 1 (eIF-1/SUI1)
MEFDTNDTKSEFSKSETKSNNIPVDDLKKTRKAIKSAEKLKLQKLKNKEPTICDFNSNDFDTQELLRINIFSSQRNTRKSITTIEDIPISKFKDDDKVQTFLLKIKNAIASRATLKNKDTKPIIEFSGSNTDRIISIICDFCSCTEDDIIIHGSH